jgi:hypothetical protein
LEAIVKILGILLALSVLATGAAQASTPTGGRQATLSGSIIYITQDKGGTLYAYQEGAWNSPVATYTGLPITNGVRGITSAGNILYISSGGAGGTTGRGDVTAWNMVTHTTVWHTALTTGVDLLSICPNGKLYVPQGEDSGTDNKVTVMDAATGAVTGTVTAPGDEAHDSVCMKSGGLYLEAKKSNSLQTPKGNVGPGPNSVRPFTVSADESLVYMTYTHFRGFAVGSTSTGKLTKTVNFGSVPSTYKISAPSHGISLNPDGSDVWVLDSPAGFVREYSATSNPTVVANVKLSHKDIGTEQNCAADCSKSGWLLNTLDGKYVLVGDSGDVISTSSHSVVGFIPALANNRHGYLEVDWSGGAPVSTSTHVGVGH